MSQFFPSTTFPPLLVPLLHHFFVFYSSNVEVFMQFSSNGLFASTVNQGFIRKWVALLFRKDDFIPLLRAHSLKEFQRGLQKLISGEAESQVTHFDEDWHEQSQPTNAEAFFLNSQILTKEFLMWVASQLSEHLVDAFFLQGSHQLVRVDQCSHLTALNRYVELCFLHSLRIKILSDWQVLNVSVLGPSASVWETVAGRMCARIVGLAVDGLLTIIAGAFALNDLAGDVVKSRPEGYLLHQLLPFLFSTLLHCFVILVQPLEAA